MPHDDGDPRPAQGGAYDYRGKIHPEYSPERDGDPDPGEVVWAWVPYEEDPHIGKDRPVVIIGSAIDAPGDLVAFMLSSQDHAGDRGWVSIGTGGWDNQGRESWVRLDRVFAVAPDAVRREGDVLSKDAFLVVVEAAVSTARDR